MDYLLSNSIEVCPKFYKDLCCNSITFANQAEEYVFGADVVVSELKRFAQREFKDFLRSRCEWDMSRWSLLTLSDNFFYLGTYPI